MAARPRSDPHGPLSFYAAGRMQRVCQVCMRPVQEGAFEVHHVLYRQRCRRAAVSEWHPHNALLLCDGCRAHHEQHSGAPSAQRISTGDLRTENVEFVLASLGAPRAYEYLRRYYRDEPQDPRVAQLIAT